MLYAPEQVATMTGRRLSFRLRRLARQDKITHKRLDRNAIRFSVGDIQALHGNFTAQGVAATPTERDEVGDGPFNFTERGKTIAPSNALTNSISAAEWPLASRETVPVVDLIWGCC